MPGGISGWRWRCSVDGSRWKRDRSENRGADEKVVILLYLGLAAALAAGTISAYEKSVIQGEEDEKEMDSSSALLQRSDYADVAFCQSR